MFTAFFIPTLTDHVAHSSYLLTLSAGLAAVTFYSITERGVNFVAWPTLNRPDDVINYSGRGYSSGKKGRLGTGRYGKNQSGPQTSKQTSVSSGRRGNAYKEE